MKRLVSRRFVAITLPLSETPLLPLQLTVLVFRLIVSLYNVRALGTPGATMAVSGNSPEANVVTVLLLTSPVLDAVITIGLSITPLVLRVAKWLVTIPTSLVSDITLTPIVIGGTLLNMVLTRVVSTLIGAPAITAMFAAPRVASVVTVATLNMLPVSTAPKLVRTLVLLEELDFVTSNIGGNASATNDLPSVSVHPRLEAPKHLRLATSIRVVCVCVPCCCVWFLIVKLHRGLFSLDCPCW